MKKIYIIGSVISILILTLSVSLAYWATRFSGEGTKMVLTTQNLKVELKDDMSLSNEIISPGWTSTKSFTIENTSKETYKYNIIIEGLVNTFVTSGYLQYKITSNNGGYNMSNWEDIPKSASMVNKILAYMVEIPVDVIQSYTISFRYLNSEDDQSIDMGKVLSGKISIKEGTKPTMYDQLLADNPTRLTRDSFNTTFTTTNTGTLYTQSGNFTEGGSTVYYFAGDAKNNWVKFGKAKDYTCTYDGHPVTYGNLQTLEIKEIGLTESECYATQICKVTNPNGIPMVGGTVMYGTGIPEAYCNVEALGGYLGEDTTFEFIKENATYEGVIHDTYWRIIRTNEDGGVRLLYAGSSPASINAFSGVSSFNGSYETYDEGYRNDAYIGYMYGTSGSLANHRTNTNNSTIKDVVDLWYSEGLNTLTDGTRTYDSYISKTAIYCNDRSTDTWNVGTSDTTTLATYNRLSNGLPSFKCGTDATGTLYSTADVADKFSVSTTNGGNGDLTYPVALITADELIYAGAYGTSLSSPYAWFYTNSEGNPATDTYYWWTMSPARIYSDAEVYIFLVRSSGSIDYYTSVNNARVVRPVVSLKSCATYSSGNGSSTSPYEITIDAECAAAEN